MSEQPFLAPLALPKTPKQRLADFKVELLQAKTTAHELLSLVGLTSSYFNFELIKNDPHTDVNKLNIPELSKLGNTIVDDYQVFKQDLDKLFMEIDEFISQVDNSLSLPAVPEEMLEMYMLQASLIHASFADWIMHYNMTVILSINMAISLHNEARPNEHKLNYILINESEEVQS